VFSIGLRKVDGIMEN
jgi:hypothetical protein